MPEKNCSNMGGKVFFFFFQELSRTSRFHTVGKLVSMQSVIFDLEPILESIAVKSLFVTDNPNPCMMKKIMVVITIDLFF